MKVIFLLFLVSYANCFYIDTESFTKEKILDGRKEENIRNAIFMATFEYNDGPVCSAVIISEDIVALAEKCVSDRIRVIQEGKVRVGTTTSGSKDSFYGILEVTYNNLEDLYWGKAALLKTEWIKFNEFTNKIDISHNIPKISSTVRVYGYGSTTDSNGGVSDKLNYADVKVYDKSVCSYCLTYVDEKIPVIFIQKSATKHDLGGPVVMYGKVVGVLTNIENANYDVVYRLAEF